MQQVVEGKSSQSQPSSAASPRADSADAGQRAGRGGLAGYGALSSALAAASIVYNPIVAASIQGVSHAVATASDGSRAQVLRRTLKVHGVLALLLGAGFLALA